MSSRERYGQQVSLFGFDRFFQYFCIFPVSLAIGCELDIYQVIDINYLEQLAVEGFLFISLNNFILKNNEKISDDRSN